MLFKRSCVPAAGPVRDWRSQGACREADPELFFGPDLELRSTQLVREAAARAVCVRCPVVAECRSWSLQAAEPYGVWGALGENERQDVLSAVRTVA
jgi:WhiB family redox-sensing transcriptional regulator